MKFASELQSVRVLVVPIIPVLLLYLLYLVGSSKCSYFYSPCAHFDSRLCASSSSRLPCAHHHPRLSFTTSFLQVLCTTGKCQVLLKRDATQGIFKNSKREKYNVRPVANYKQLVTLSEIRGFDPNLDCVTGTHMSSILSFRKTP